MERTGSAEPALQALLAAVIESTDDGVVTATLDGKITSANSAAAHMFGYSIEEFVALHVSDLAVPERVRVSAEIMSRLRRGEQIGRYRAEFMRKNGERFPASVTVSHVRGDNGGVPTASAIIQDLSDSRDADRTRALLAAIVQSSVDAIYARKRDGTITSWNPSAERLFGYSSEEVVGRPLSILVPRDVEDDFADVEARVRRGQTVADKHTIRVTKDGKRIPVSITVFPVTGDDGAVLGYASITRDMLRNAETQRAFRKLERLTEREREVLGLVSDGLGNVEISRRLGLSPQTVKNYVSRILMKLDVATRTEAAASFLSLRSFLGPTPPAE